MAQTMEQARECAVWERVRAAQTTYPPQREDPGTAQSCEHTVTSEQLREWIDHEWEDAALYRHLAGCLPPCAQRYLLEMATDEQGHARRLSAHYYAATGGCVERQGGYTPVCCPMETLRRQYAAELTGAQAYGDASRCAEGMLAELLDELSRDEARHSRMVMQLLECVI